MSEQTLSSEEGSSTQADATRQKRKKLLSLVAILFIIGVVVYVIWHVFFSQSEDTDNAYVGANTAQVNSVISGQVQQVLVDDTQYVHAGDVVIKLDDRDAKIAVAQAEADLLKVKRQYGQTEANSDSLTSQIRATDSAIQSQQAQVNKAQSDLIRAQKDLERRTALNASGAISKEEYTTAQNALNTAQANLALNKAGLAQAISNQKVAESNLKANEALIKGTTSNTTPDVLAAQAKLDQANLNLTRTVIKAPIDGIITNRNVQVGQTISSGSALMLIVPIHALYVDANFKENQLAHVKPGQVVKLTSDLYGDDVVFHGTVVGLSGGTGAAFALIPAQNATGNWIKVVQRLPVRIHLQPEELKKHPLRVGLSMTATVDLKSD
ncbi:EmrA/EmrK family multidrug efflux transporter periplasmic adaptor subunit [Acinetobacter apis]|uniref:Membrane fusion protein, multidrug efflux system n=1 Tax=Acinetobacter apis TaxID=1229165 RepID=A0A217ECE8_9GAMM|nr:HlyD family efflux transporter periplasmic adaptor subunit [Acinetobacter apis]SNQ28131.1 membrane fusion protein, multidrug efflux system [Acinetobacter apis]